MPQPRRVTPTAEALRLWPGHPAGGVIGPVAVEPDDAPLDAPARADHAGVLGDRIVDGVLAAVRDLDDAAAEAARNGVGGPGAGTRSRGSSRRTGCADRSPSTWFRAG